MRQAKRVLITPAFSGLENVLNALDCYPSIKLPRIIYQSKTINRFGSKLSSDTLNTVFIGGHIETNDSNGSKGKLSIFCIFSEGTLKAVNVIQP